MTLPIKHRPCYIQCQYPTHLHLYHTSMGSCLSSWGIHQTSAL